MGDQEVDGGRMGVYKKYLVGRPNRKGRAVLFLVVNAVVFVRLVRE